MKQYTVLTFIGILLVGITENSFSWDSTASKYYPLAVGNQWSYHRIDRTGFNCIQYTNEYDYLVTVVSDTLMPNGKRYFRLQGPTVTFERVDSVSMNIYRYSSGGECITDSLLARINNNFNSCRQFNNTGQFQVLDTNSISFLNVSRKTKAIRGNLLIGHQYTLMYGMGLYRESACENGGAIITLNGCIINGVQYGALLGIENSERIFPNKFSLSQNYPNPFNPTTHFGFWIAESGLVRLTVYDVLGKEVQTMVNEELLPGSYETDWNASAYPSGIYYYKLESGSYSETKKMVLIK
jgi:hypothetical protein